MSQPNTGANFAFNRQSALAAGLVALAIVFSGPTSAADNGAPKWQVWNYNPSGRALNGGVPAPAGGNGIATFSFPADPNTALLITDHGSYKGTLLGDLTGRTISATVSDASGPFTYYGQGTPGDCPGTPATVRLFFQTSNAGGFNETHYWWSNPVSLPLNGLTAKTTMSASLANPGNWSDFYGHFGSDPQYNAGYQDAVKNVTSIGLSFGGGCFFENGVGAPTGGSFTLWSFSAN